MVKDFGKWVHCTSYLKPVRDGRCLDTAKDSKENITEVRYIGIGDDIPDKCNCEGALEFLKTYYEKRSAEFDGVLVGTKKVVIDGYLYADTEYHPYKGEFIRVGKQPNTTEMCGIVFFGNNQKRLVPMKNLLVVTHKEAKSEAIKEFAEMIKNDWYDKHLDSPDVDFDDYIDDLAKRMIGGKDNA